tara:strand:+ start:1483 stop:3606 length:2124 start_codon:yes stop_codon:yes gene_type:complete
MAEDQNNIVDEVGGEGAPMPAPEPEVEAEVAADPAPETKPETGPEVTPDRIEYMLPGFPQPISLPGNLSNEQRAKAISAYLQSDDAKRFIDRDTGAPPFVRSQVGGSPAQDRLANIKRFFPDAAPYGNDNFIYTNPNTGRLTLYNEEGFSVGDVASVTREAFLATGGTFGAILGTPGGPPGVAFGAGTGTTVAGEIYDTYSKFVLGSVDTRSVFDRSVDAGTEFFLSAVGQRGGELLTEGAKRVLGGGTKKAAQLAEKFRLLRIEPPASAVSSSNTVASLETFLGSTPFAGDKVQKQAQRIVEQVNQAARDTIAKFGAPGTPQEAGAVIKAARQNALVRFEETQEAAYQKAFKLIGEDTPVALDAVRALRVKLETRLLDAPGSLQKSLGPAVATLKTIELEDTVNAAVPGTLKFGILRQIRTDIGKDLATPMQSGYGGSVEAAMRQVYAAVTEDLSAVAKLAGPEARKSLEVADRYTRAWKNTAGVTLEKIGKAATEEQAYKYATAGMNTGGTNLARLQRQFEPEEWDSIAASVLQELGAKGDDFSVNQFIRKYGNMSKEAKDALFGSKRYAEMREGLDTLIEVGTSLEGVQKYANTSNTGRVLNYFLTFQALGGGLAGLTLGEGDATAGIGGVLTTLAASRYGAHLITSPKFINWLITPVTDPNGIGAHFGRLTAIAAEDPALKEPIAAFLRTFEGTPQPQGVEQE